MNSHAHSSAVGAPVAVVPKSTVPTIKEIEEKDLLELIGLSHLSAEEKESTYQTMVETIQHRVVARISDALDDAKFAEWEKLVDAGKSEKSQQFLMSSGIDLDQIYAQETLLYKIEMVQLTEVINRGATA